MLSSGGKLSGWVVFLDKMVYSCSTSSHPSDNGYLKNTNLKETREISGSGGKGNPLKRSDNILNLVKFKESGLAVSVTGLLALLFFFFALNNCRIENVFSLVSIDFIFFIISNKIILWSETVTQDNSYLFITY